MTARGYRRPAGWRSRREEMGGGLLIDAGIHYLHLLRAWVGPVDEVMAMAPPNALSPGSRARTRSSCSSGSGAGPSATLANSIAAPGLPRWQWTWVTGTEGSLGVDHRGRAVWLRGRSGTRARLFVRDRRGLVAQLAEFVAAVREGRPPAFSPGVRAGRPGAGAGGVSLARDGPAGGARDAGLMPARAGDQGGGRGMTSFAGKIAVVTGGGSGIGRALALGLAREGARVVVADVDEAAAAETVRLVAATGSDGLAVRANVAERADVESLADRVFQRYGAVHVLCNNAGVVVHGGLEAATWEDWQWVLGVNLWGVVHGLLAFLPRMIARGEGGHVVNTASMAGLIASQGLGVYNTSKYAVVGLSETLAKDLRPHGIGVTVVCPMGVDTRIRAADRNRPAALRNASGASGQAEVTLIGRTLGPEEVAERTLAAIRAGELYVITHDEAIEPLRRRFQRLERAARRRPEV